MIIETPNPFSLLEEWEQLLTELRKIDLTSLSAEDVEDLKEAIARAELFVDKGL